MGKLWRVVPTDSRAKYVLSIALLSLLCMPGSVWASGITQYTYTGAQYGLSDCVGSYCSGGPYDLVVTFDVAAGTPLDGLNDVDITADVSSFSFSDGSGFVITNADTTFSDQFVISTGSSGNITVWSLNVCTTPPYLAPGSSAGGACMDTYWAPSDPQVLDRTNWTDGSEQGECFAYGSGAIASSTCLGTFAMSSPGSTVPEPSSLLLLAIALLSLLATARGNIQLRAKMN
jgi:hypothetical protein